MQKVRLLLAIILTVSLFLIVTGCGTKVKHYKYINQALDKEQYTKMPLLVKKAREYGDYKRKDRVLYYLDLGLANHYAGKYKESNENLEKAEQYIRELFTRSISRKGWSMLTNNNQLPYYGEEYENIYINIFKALNYVHLNKSSEAFVEIRDMYVKLSYMEQKYKKKAEKYKKRKAPNEKVKKAIKQKRDDLKIESEFTNSALGRYFNYAMYTSNEKWDDSRISLENMNKAFAEQRGIYNFRFPKSLILPYQRKTKKEVVHSIALLGHGPIKKQQAIRVPIPDIGVLKFVMPQLEPRGTNLTSIKLFKDSELVTELQKVEDVHRVARAVFDMKKPLILYKNLFRTVVKEVGGEVASGAAEEKGGDAARIAADLATAIYTEVSEQADLRTTRLLPGEFRIASFYLPQGRNHLQAKFYSNGQVVECKELHVEVSTDGFNMIEIISPN